MAITTRAPARSRRAISVAAAMNGASTASPTRRLIVPYLEAIAEAPYLFDGALVKKLNQLYPTASIMLSGAGVWLTPEASPSLVMRTVGWRVCGRMLRCRSMAG